MKKKRVRLSKESISIVKSSLLTAAVLADIVGCSVGTVDYYRNRGIWRKKR